MIDESKQTPNLDPFYSVASKAGRTDRYGDRGNYTFEERMVVALEMTVDRLEMIQVELRSLNQTIAASVTRIPPYSGSSDEGQERWDNEGGCFTEEGDLDPDLIRTMEQHYAVGPYHYTNLQDATAQAERARRADKSPGEDFAV